MDINISGNPGTGNRYDNVSMAHVDNYNPHATHVSTTYNIPEAKHCLTYLYHKLRDEVAHDDCLKDKFEDLHHYRTRLPHTIKFEDKLKDGGFPPADIQHAKRSRLAFSKKSMKYQYFVSARRIDDYLFAKVLNQFRIYVMPLVREERPLDEILRMVHEQVIVPIHEEVTMYGADDEYLSYDMEDLYGMLYFLTGNCHINWTDYDVHPRL